VDHGEGKAELEGSNGSLDSSSEDDNANQYRDRFLSTVFTPLKEEVQEKLERTEKLYNFCVDLLSDGALIVNSELSQTSTFVTPPRL